MFLICSHCFLSLPTSHNTCMLKKKKIFQNWKEIMTKCQAKQNQIRQEKTEGYTWQEEGLEEIIGGQNGKKKFAGIGSRRYISAFPMQLSWHFVKVLVLI